MCRNQINDQLIAIPNQVLSYYSICKCVKLTHEWGIAHLVLKITVIDVLRNSNTVKTEHLFKSYSNIHTVVGLV